MPPVSAMTRLDLAVKVIHGLLVAALAVVPAVLVSRIVETVTEAVSQPPTTMPVDSLPDWFWAVAFGGPLIVGSLLLLGAQLRLAMGLRRLVLLALIDLLWLLAASWGLAVASPFGSSVDLARGYAVVVIVVAGIASAVSLAAAQDRRR